MPTERGGSVEHQAGGRASASGGVPLLAEVEGQTNYHYVRSSTETRSVQDAIFEEFVIGCHPLDVSLLHPWPDAAAVPDGRLVLVRGFIKLIDYQDALEALRAFPKVLNGYQKFLAAASTTSSRAKGQATSISGSRSKGQAEALAPLIEGMSKLVGSNLGDFVRIKVMPDIERPDEAFVGDGHRDNFRYPSAILAALYPGGLAEGWQCVGLVHRSTARPESPKPDPTTLGDILESLLDQMSGLEAFRQTARPPEISFTPLAISRLLVYG